MPATSAYHFSYTGKMRRIPFPRWREADTSYPGRIDYGADYFDEIPDAERRWIAAVDASGSGLFQTSTDRMRGRKLFHWGTGSGGRNWQDWLSGPRQEYFEIQAGLARTPAGTPAAPGAPGAGPGSRRTACSGPAAEDVHGSKWPDATKAAATALDDLLPAYRLDEELATMTALADRPPEEVLHAGTGWGALERRALGRNRALNLPGTPFPDATIGRDQQSWLFPGPQGPDADAGPGAAAVVLCRRSGLAHSAGESGLRSRARDLVHLAYHLGVNRYHAGDLPGAREAWEQSMAQAETAWAHRNLAVLDEADGRPDDAANRYLRAWQLSPRLRPLTIETLRALIGAKRPGEALDIVDRLKEPDRFAGRILMLECRAALDAGDLVRARRILDTGLVVEDVREGEDPLSDMWWRSTPARPAGSAGVTQRLREEHPLPCSYDYSVRQL